MHYAASLRQARIRATRGRIAFATPIRERVLPDSPLNQLGIHDSVTWGLQAARLFPRHWGTEVIFSQQKPTVQLGTTDASGVDLFSMTMRQLQGNIVYEFGDRIAAVRPFLFGGWRDRDDLLQRSGSPVRDEAVVRLRRRPQVRGMGPLGMRAHVRFKPSILGDKSAGDVCDPFGFCQNSLSQIEIAAGAIIRSPDT